MGSIVRLFSPSVLGYLAGLIMAVAIMMETSKDVEVTDLKADAKKAGE
jgi:hypothetical protein